MLSTVWMKDCFEGVSSARFIHTRDYIKNIISRRGGGFIIIFYIIICYFLLAAQLRPAGDTRVRLREPLRHLWAQVLLVHRLEVGKQIIKWNGNVYNCNRVHVHVQFLSHIVLRIRIQEEKRKEWRKKITFTMWLQKWKWKDLL